MKLEIRTKEKITVIDLDMLAARYAGIVNIGKKSNKVWNTIAIEDESIDDFQCSLIGVAGFLKLKNGQNRSECPRGLMSDKTVPCSSCMGRCVGVHPGKAKFFQRDPELPTLLNGKPVSQWGEEIKVGDVISFAEVEICVNE